MDEHDREDVEALSAISRVQSYLTERYIVDECAEGPPTLGCVSCQLIALRRQLEMVSEDIIENMGGDDEAGRALAALAEFHAKGGRSFEELKAELSPLPDPPSIGEK